MEDRETPQMHKYGESKTTRIMMATVPHVISGSGLRKFQADGFFDRQSVRIRQYDITITQKYLFTPVVIVSQYSSDVFLPSIHYATLC
jgi:hypothetical protein